MSDIDTIKERVRKLMAVASDGVATDGEIDNAMRLAAKLIDQHHIEPDEVSDGDDEADDSPIEMGRAYGTSQTGRLSTWESSLGQAISRLFGCVQMYVTHDQSPVRVNGVVKLDSKGKAVYGRRVCFYGPLIESKEAASLFKEWSRSIATMGVVRWGGCFRGDGAAYCYGFATALYKKACTINAERQQITARATPKLIGGDTCTAITLAARYGELREQASEWLKQSEGIHLHSSGSRSGYSGCGGEAHAEGRAHGQAAQFGRAAKRKLLN